MSVGVPQDDPVLVASTLQIVSGDGQEGEVGLPLSEPLVVRVLTAEGSPLAGAPISWEVVNGRGSPRGQSSSSSDFTTVTAADGTSSVDWELGTAAGSQQVWAEIALAPSTTSMQGVSQAPGSGNGSDNGKKVGFTANGRPGELRDVVVTPTDPNVATGDTLDFDASALDKWGNELGGVSWQWRSSNQSVATVDGNGTVVAMAEGESEIVATTDGNNSGSEMLHVWNVVDTTTTGPTDATIRTSGGDGQSGVVARQLSDPLSVTVLDGNGQPYADVTLRWVFAAGTGSSAEGSGRSFYAHTNAQGASSVTWTLGTTAGTQAAYAEIVVAEDGSGTTRRVYFESQASPDQPDRILLSSSSISLQVGDQVSVTATVIDQFGNEIPDAQVTWSSADPSVATVTESAPAGTGSSGAS